MMTGERRTSENGLLNTVLQDFYSAADAMGLDESLISILSHSERRLDVSVPVEMDNGAVKVFRGYRVQHCTALGPSKGGIRYAPDVDVDECEGLAMLMTWKCSLAGIPYGGGKGGVACVPQDLSKRERQRMTRTFAARIEPNIGRWSDIPAPDMNTGGQEMVWIMDTISKMRGQIEPAQLTGKPIAYWGAMGRNEASGLGVATCGLELMKALGKDPSKARVAIQGFGNVGSFTAKSLAEAGATVVAISDSTGTYYSPGGLDINKAFEQLCGRTRREREGFVPEGCEKLGPSDVLAVDCDFLFPCAVQGVINKDTAPKVKARYIIEGANNPTTVEAGEFLERAGAIIVPDFLANSGGVISSYFEWVQNLQGLFWSKEEHDERLLRLIKGNFKRVWDHAEAKKISMRRAAYVAAIQRVVDAVELRGIYL